MAVAAQNPQTVPRKLWHTYGTDKTLEELNVDPEQGLSDSEISSRLAKYGPNELIDNGTKNPLLILWEQITDPLVLVLLFAALVSALLGEIKELIAIMSIVIINAVLGVVQEYRAERAMQALKQMAAPMVRVRRNGKARDVESTTLVPGDVIMLESGNIVPADARLIDSANLRVQEASLTGESEAVDKIIDSIPTENAPVGDRKNMVYMGTAAAYGRGTAVVVNTGMQTELGRIATLIQDVESEPTPLQRRMAEVGRVMFVASIGVAIVAMLVGIFAAIQESGITALTEHFVETVTPLLLDAVAIAVAVVPEGLPAVVTVSLALGTQRMLKRNALIRKLPAVETLGSVTVICSDKTGTLTQNLMQVVIVDVPGKRFDLTPVMQSKLARGRHYQLDDLLEGLLLLSGTMANDSEVDRVDNSETDYIVLGDPTEAAISLAAARFGMVKHEMEAVYTRIGEVPFSSERKMMTTIHENTGQLKVDDNYEDQIDKIFEGYRYMAFSKGAPDKLVDACNRIWKDGTVHPMNDHYYKTITKTNENLANGGLRVLGIAFCPLEELPKDNQWELAEKDLIFVGLVGIIDPPRPEVKRAVAVSKAAGIRPVMITGDHPITAKAIARDLEIIDANGRAVIGADIEMMSVEELKAVVKEVSVFARVSPEHKLRIVRAFQELGHIVAMTGDGVNDAPALKQADIGVAMSIAGTDVSKEAADMVILDDNFATIVSAAEEGRTIYDNVRRFIKYLLASNSGELFVLLVMQAIPGVPLPMTTLQILWMNLVTDGVPALALGVEQGEKNSMNRPPYAPDESVFGRGLGRHIIIVGSVLGLSALTLGLTAYNAGWTALNGAPAWNTMVFVMLTLAQMGHAYGLRSHTQSVFTLNPLTNRFLLYALVITTVVQLSTVYLPFFNNLFGTNPLNIWQLAICLILSSLVFIAVEVEKIFIRRGGLRA